MNCQDCQNELLQQEGRLSDAALAHLDGCNQCRAFAQALTLAVPPKPTPEVDARVLDSCRGILAARRRLRRSRRLLLGVAAAAAVLLSVALFHTHTPQPSPRLPNAAGTAAVPGEYTDALSWDVGVSIASAELDRMELDLELLTAGL